MTGSNDQPVTDPVRPKDRFLVFGSPQIQEAEIDEVVASMRAAWLGTGPKVARFEAAFNSYVGGEHAAAVNSCTAALHLSLLAAGLGPGDEVIAPALTFAATVNAIIHTGATPVLADVDLRTMNIDLDDIERRITPATRALLPVHFAGRACDMDRIMDMAERHSLKVIEDAAHAVETTFRGRHAGTFGDFGCFSFYATKNVTTGEGGMVIARDADEGARIKVLALHGLSADAWKRFSDAGYKHYYVLEAGFKYNMMDLQAAIGLHQLERVEANWVRRQAIWSVYQEQLAGSGLGLPAEPDEDTRHAYHLYTIRVDEDVVGIGRDAFVDAITQQGIGVGVHYQSIPEHPYYRERFGWSLQDVPNAASIGKQTVSLPLSPKLTDQDVADVLEAVKRVIARVDTE
jgi:dTDP-4-amino-4,6-dideoxygalactose transaminase